MSLSQEIMNLRCYGATDDSDDLYKFGHRDARHAAAELPGVLQAERDAIDARRYRWLREANWTDCTIMGEVGIRDGEPETLDAAIDAAMRGERVKGEGE